MKRPAFRFDKEAALEGLLRHGEKVVVAILGVCAAWLLWGGIDAVRSKSVGAGQMPDVISRKAADAMAHLDRVADPPAELLPAHTPLSESLDRWRSPLLPWRSSAALELVDAPAMPPLDKPLFDELAKRPKPDVLPLEDLRATAGIAVLAVKAGGGAGGGEQTLAAGSPGRIVPYVLVTGLIPAGKQRAEYRRRFADVGFPDAKRDAPLWSDFEIDRAVVGAGGKEAWERIDLAAASKQWASEWAAEAPTTIPGEYLLAAAEDGRSRQTTPIAFCGPLPQRVDDGWKTDALHPWVLARLKAKGAPQAGPDAAPVNAGGDAAPPADGPGFGPTEPATPTVAPVPPREEAKLAAPEYRMFRFIDTAVEPGKAYRYRVRLKVWNPNVGLPQQHLADPAFAVGQKLTTADSNLTTAVTVPESMALLARTLRSADQKRMRMKPEVFEIMVLAESRKTGNYALRSLLSYVGGIANIDSRLNKPPVDVRCRGEDIETKWLFVDAFGQQLDRADTAAAKGGRQIGDPLEMLFLRPDGTFAIVSAADSEQRVQQYAATLPEADDGRREAKQAGQEAAPAERSVNPFAPPRAP